MKNTLLLAGLTLALAAPAAPILPAGDADVVETLPAGGQRGEERRLRRQLAERPGDAALAVSVAQRFLERARVQGEPRYAGLALGALAAWPDPTLAPPEVALMRATLAQYLHDFEGAASTLEALLKRSPAMGQAWLTLATIRRVQGRYDASDAACAALARQAPGLHAEACRAENDALRGRFDAARARFRQLAQTAGLDGATRGWLLTSLAELEERAGRGAAAESVWREALRADPSPYPTIAYADFLILRGRDADVLALLEPLPRGDAVLLRLAIAGHRSGAADAAPRVAEMRERIALANLRPDTPTFHGREQAMFALWVDGDAPRALELARRNVELQREPIDLLLYAQSARSAGRADALQAAKALAREVGLRDARIEAIG
jgi:tetratricopeptide (TPR) repeat protein